jgi:hypothetical protein
MSCRSQSAPPPASRERTFAVHLQNDVGGHRYRATCPSDAAAASIRLVFLITLGRRDRMKAVVAARDDGRMAGAPARPAITRGLLLMATGPARAPRQYQRRWLLARSIFDGGRNSTGAHRKIQVANTGSQPARARADRNGTEFPPTQACCMRPDQRCSGAAPSRCPRWSNGGAI